MDVGLHMSDVFRLIAGDYYNGFMPKKHFPGFLFSVVLKKNESK